KLSAKRITPPTSGSHSRWRSSSASSVPATSSISGPRGRWSGWACIGKSCSDTSIDDGEGDHVVVLVAQTEVCAEAALGEIGGERLVVLEIGFARGVVPHPHRVQRGRHRDAGAERLAEGLLGSEALGEEARPIDALGPRRALGAGEDAMGEALAVALERAPHTFDADDVGADAVDHG